MLRRKSEPAIWEAIEKEKGRNKLRAYELTSERLWLGPTTNSGKYKGGEDSLFQLGYSKDDPTLRQVSLYSVVSCHLPLMLYAGYSFVISLGV